MKEIMQTLARTTYLWAISGVFMAIFMWSLLICLTLIAIRNKNNFQPSKIVLLFSYKVEKQIKLKILETLRIASLKSKFTGYYYKNSEVGYVDFFNLCFIPTLHYNNAMGKTSNQCKKIAIQVFLVFFLVVPGLSARMRPFETTSQISIVLTLKIEILRNFPQK